jgi:hypothetical protein
MILNICGLIQGFRWSTSMQSPLDILGFTLLIGSLIFLIYSIMCRTERI